MNNTHESSEAYINNCMRNHQPACLIVVLHWFVQLGSNVGGMSEIAKIMVTLFMDTKKEFKFTEIMCLVFHRGKFLWWIFLENNIDFLNDIWRKNKILLNVLFQFILSIQHYIWA